MSITVDPFADVIVGIDLGEALQDLEEFKQEAARTRQAVITNLRIAGQTAIFMAQAIGGTLSAIYGMMLESVLIGLEVAFAITGGTFGITNVFQIGQILLMIRAIQQIKQGRANAAAITQNEIGVLRLASTIRF